MRRFLLAAALLAACVPAIAHAQARRLSGTVASLDGDRLTVTLGGGQSALVIIDPATRMGALANRRLSDIKPGAYVGSAAIPGEDGRLHAQEVHIFPEGMRGTGEGHKPMDQPGRTMTNATVAEVAVAPSGHTLTLKYPGGQQVIEVDSDARIIALIAGDRSLLTPGAAVMVLADPSPDGSFAAKFIQAEKDGVKPLN